MLRDETTESHWWRSLQQREGFFETLEVGIIGIFL